MYTNNQSLCDRLRQRYGNSQQNWEWFSKDSGKDFEYIQYIVNFIIEQAKHSIVIFELPDVIRTLHCEAEAILRKDRMITLQEVIAQVQKVGAIKYPYLKKLKPISTEDFVNEVLRVVFDRLGNIITLDRIENICQFTTCSAKQLLQAMPAIDVNEAAILIIEDISRNQRDNQKQNDVDKKIISIPLSTSMNRQVDQKLDSRLTPVREERMISKHGSLRSTQNSHISSKNVNKNQQGQSNDPTRHFTQISNIKADRSVRKSIVNERKAEIVTPSITNSFTISNNQKINLSRSKSSTQTYSIHSEEGLSTSKHIKQTSESSTETISLSQDQNANKSPLKMLQSIRQYSKYCYQHSNISDNEEEITENCPLEDILHHRLLQPT